MTPDFAQLVAEAEACRRCAAELPRGCRPVFQVDPDARVLLVGQAPGAKVHASGRPFTDPSGDRLRSWLQMDEESFYDPKKLAIVPTGLCFPGTNPKGGDFPPDPRCAPLWQPRFLEALPRIELILLIGSYAQAYHLGPQRKKTMTETVATWRSYQPRYLPLPHPSWRNTAWLKENPWFETDVLPHLRERLASLL